MHSLDCLLKCDFQSFLYDFCLSLFYKITDQCSALKTCLKTSPLLTSSETPLLLCLLNLLVPVRPEAPLHSIHQAHLNMQ